MALSCPGDGSVPCEGRDALLSLPLSVHQNLHGQRQSPEAPVPRRADVATLLPFKG